MTVDVATSRAAFLAALHEGCEGLLEFRAFTERKGAPPVGREFYAPSNHHAIDRFVAAHRDHHVYFGVATRTNASSGTLENCRHLGALYADIDFKITPEAEARACVARFPLPMSAVVQSGGGLHVYWFLREPLDLRDEVARAEAYQLLRRLGGALHGDMAAAEPARVLRVPGTFNRKPDYPVPRGVVVEMLKPDRRYNPGDLDAVLPPEPAGTRDGEAFVLPERIAAHQPGRNHTLWRYGRSLRAKGWKLPRILAELERINRERCEPPLPDAELGDIAHNIFTEKDRPTFTASGNGSKTPAASSLPEINASEGDLKRVSDQAWEALLAKNDPPVVFSFGGAPSWIEHDDRGMPLVKIMSLDRVRYRLARVAEWYSMKARKDAPPVRVPARPPKDVSADLLARPDPPLPRLTRIVEVPVFASNGRLLDVPGYDRESGILFAPAPGFTMAPVPAEPDRSMRELACAIVGELLSDFPFTAPAERAHAVALFLLPYVREQIDGPTPLHQIEKPMPGTGATLLVESLMLPATGRPVPAMGAPRDDGEMGKRLTALLRRGATVVFIDNIPEKYRLDSPELARAITAGCWNDRILGLSEDVRLPVRCVFVASGNNPVLSSELARRTVRSRLDARMEHPADRQTFRHPDLRTWVKDNRGDLVWAAVTLVQAWIAAGRPEGSAVLGGFESWSKTMGGILDVASIPGFLENLKEFRQATDSEGAAIRGFLAAWWKKYEGGRLSVATLYELAKDSDLELTAATDQGSKIRLGKLLLKLKDCRYPLPEGGTVFVKPAGTVEGKARWSLVRE